jgi:hypothetical protein
MCQLFKNDLWVNESFGSVNLRDKRLSTRLEKIVSKIIEKPEASLPAQMGNWSGVMACYRLLNNPKVTHKRVQSTHVMRTRKETADGNGKVKLFLQDGSEIEAQKSTKGAGPIGNHTCQGLMMHNCLAVEYNEENPEVLGLANQRIWKRNDIVLNKSETRSQRNHRKGKESEHWLKTLKDIGSPSGGEKWVSIGDRGNDIYEFCNGVRKLKWEAVFRASQDRLVEIEGQENYLMEWVKLLPKGGTRTITVRRQEDTKAKQIALTISWGQVNICPPKRVGRDSKLITLSVVRCFNEEEGIEWVLYSTIPVNTLEEAIEKIKWYACRWIIEEYHKCLKTGCRIESNQFESIKPVEVLLGILSVVAVLMLQMKYIAREKTNDLAKEVVPMVVLAIICRRYKLEKEKITIRDFWRTVAMLGGFLGRKSDGDPGWQTLWKGWLRLLDMWNGAEALRSIQEQVN